MAKRKRKRVGGVFRFGKSGEPKDRLDHSLHLQFARLPLSDCCPLCLCRRIFKDGDLSTSRR